MATVLLPQSARPRLYRGRRARFEGLGEYPGYVCYDKDRPGWLPYWLDDFTESGCRWSPSTIGGNIASCLNPFGSDCSPDSWINLNMATTGGKVALGVGLVAAVGVAVFIFSKR